MSPIYTPGKLTLQKAFTQQSYMWEFPAQYGLWSPANITTALWLDASDNTTIFSDAGTIQATNGQGVYQWNDKSGNGRHVTQETSGNRPSLTTNSLNGRSSITFADSSRWLLGSAGAESAFDFTSTLYLFFIGQISKSGSNIFINKGRGTFNATGWYADFRGPAQSLIGITSSGSYSSVDSASIVSLNTDTLLGFEANGSTVRSRVNGATISTVVDGKAAWAATANNDTLAIGLYSTGSTVNYQGIMRQIIVMSSVPSLANIEKLEGWAAHFYGITSVLPSDHPYKTVGPTV